MSHHAVASGHRLTSETAADILAAGGTAVDAVLAAAFTAFVAEPVLAGPLGGGFLMVTPRDGTSRLLDAFVTTPSHRLPETEAAISAIDVDFGPAIQTFHIGPGTTAAPCLIPGLFEAHSRHGRIPMTELAAPACRLARDGHTITGFQAHVMSLVAPILSATPETRALYHAEGSLKPAGVLHANPALADLLETLAIEGPRLTTEGEVASLLLDQPGSHLSADDLRRAVPVWRGPLTVTRSGRIIEMNPPPSLGGLQIALGLQTLPRAPSLAAVAQALGAINRARRASGLDSDPETAAAGFLDPSLVAQLRETLAGHRPATRGTTHISVTDRDGSAAALTLSNGEGNGEILAGTGIMPNNMLGEEDLVPGGPHAWTPNRRLASMMCPMSLRAPDGTTTMLGSGGSNRIRSALLRVATLLADTDLGLAEAIAAPRLHVEAGKLDFEDTGGEAHRAALLEDWPEATPWPEPSMFFGGVHAVRSGPTGTDAFGDPRRSGHACLA